MIIEQNIQIEEDYSLDRSIEEQITNQTKQKYNPSIQKVHNDQHIYYFLKAASTDTYDQSIFSLNMKSNTTKENRLRIKIKSKKQFRNSVNLKQSLTQNSIQTSKLLTESNFKSASSIQRINKKVDIKGTQTPMLKFDNLECNKNSSRSNNSLNQRIKINKNIIHKRNYFNVKQFLELQANEKNQNAVIMIKNNSNFLAKRKKQKFIGQSSLPSEKIKQFQFNAIQITKNVIQKSFGKYGINNRIRTEDKKTLLKPNKSYSQGLNGKKKQLSSAPNRQYFNNKLIDDFYGQRGSLWRSNSYKIPKSKQIIAKSVNELQINKNVQKIDRYFRNDNYENNIELNPWSMGKQINFSNIKSRYPSCKTEDKHRQQDNQFLHYYITTARHKRQKIIDQN